MFVLAHLHVTARSLSLRSSLDRGTLMPADLVPTLVIVTHSTCEQSINVSIVSKPFNFE